MAKKSQPVADDTPQDSTLQSSAESPVDEAVDAPASTIAEEDVDESNYEESLRQTLPAHERTLPGAELFAEACICYGVNPDPDVLPIEILPGEAGARWKLYAGNRLRGEVDTIAFVTAGGVKVRHPMDEQFEAVLRRWFGLIAQDPKTHEVVILPLPNSLTLPREAVTGIARKVEHVFPKGYLRSRAAAAARSQRG